MFVLNSQDQGIITLAQQDYLPMMVDSFITDRKAQGLSPETRSFYRKKLEYFLRYCDGQAVTRVSQISPDLILRNILGLSESHNPGGVHACFRPLRTLLLWLEEEDVMPAESSGSTKNSKAVNWNI